MDIAKEEKHKTIKLQWVYTVGQILNQNMWDFVMFWLKFLPTRLPTFYTKKVNQHCQGPHLGESSLQIE